VSFFPLAPPGVSVENDKLCIESEALIVLAFIFPFQAIPWTAGVPLCVAIIGGILLKTKLAKH
jgi:hypothetical protein